MTRLLVALAMCLVCGCCSQKPRPTSRPSASAGDWDKMASITPLIYPVRRASSPVVIDGRLDDAAWTDAPWTDYFVDIEGDVRPVPRFRTRARMLWDDRYLYVAAEIQEPHVCATLTEKNSIIFHDNDFEIFLDSDGDHHNYYEFEMNALNTIWELTLPVPYRDGGKARLGTNLPALRSAVALQGSINDPRDVDQGWTLEVAIPFGELSPYNPSRHTPPMPGDVWRANFSRVQWTWDVVDGKYVRRPKETNPEDNWVWSPQGVIDMHRPERWGFLVFSPPDLEAATAAIRQDLATRDALVEIYYRKGISTPGATVRFQGDGWTASLPDPAVAGRRWFISSDSRLWAE